jgi:predicted amidohydrolase YtcJ
MTLFDPEALARIVCEKSVWLSGLYVLDDGLMPAVIVATADPELFDVTVYNYSFIGFGDEQFFAYERLIWPVGADHVYSYFVVDETNLELQSTISLDDLDGDLSDLTSDDIEDIVQVLAPLLQPLVPVDGSGRPTGELQEMAAYTIPRFEMRAFRKSGQDPVALRRYANMARLVGCTTISEIGGDPITTDAHVDKWLGAGATDGFPSRLVPYFGAGAGWTGGVSEGVEWVAPLATRSTDMVEFGLVKIVLDGSIQGYTARLRPPGYLPHPDGSPRDNGIWLLSPEAFAERFFAFHAAGITVHTHVNGDEATELLVETAEEAVRARPWSDHRHTAQHSQLTTREQYRRMAAIGMNANIFVNHISYWGDQHAALTVGPDRAARMDGCATADAEGVRYSIHCDASVTPLGCLHTMWAAVNRVTSSGVVLGPDERISAERALRAVTIDAAHQMRMEDRIGSITPGKFADFVALAEDPLEVEPMTIRDIEVRGTVVGGAVTEALAT